MYEVKLDSVQVLLICWPHNCWIWFRMFVETEYVLSQNTTVPSSADGIDDTGTGLPSISIQTFSCANEVEVCTRFEPELLFSDTLVKIEHSCVCIMIRSSGFEVLIVALNRTISEPLVPATVVISGVVSRFEPATPILSAGRSAPACTAMLAIRSEIAIAATVTPDTKAEVFFLDCVINSLRPSPMFI